MLSAMWFRSDLRIEDNPALSAAMTNGPTIAFFFITEQSWQEHDLAPAKKSLLIRQATSLASNLASLNVPLLTVNCAHFNNIPKNLVKLCRKHQVTEVFFNHEYEINERTCTKHVVNMLQDQGILSRGSHDQCAIKPGQIKTGNGDWYKVFTAFKRNYLAHFSNLARPLAKQPRKQKPMAITADIAALSRCDIDAQWKPLWPEGSAEAHKRLKRFVSSSIHTYHQWRDFPAENGTSTLSPYLAVGAISVSQCMDAAWLLGGGDFYCDQSEGPSTWINELIWRDFYRHLMFAHPDICKYKAYKTETERLPWRHSKKLFNAWTAGKTGYPIVDAAMHQLTSTGWMHNRLRMVVAMFLTKHLFVDWRWGERHFMQHLVDGDLASNNGGWQWSASTGVDAAPYFRIFNPVRQSERFDPKGTFIRQYVPELQSLDNRSIHMPTSAQAKEVKYPLPIVDHKQAVTQTKQWFQAL